MRINHCLIIFLVLTTPVVFAQRDSTLLLFFTGARDTVNMLERVSPRDLQFRFEDAGGQPGSMEVSVLHHRGTARFAQAGFRFDSQPVNFVPLKFPQLKPGDQLTFTFHRAARKIVKTYSIHSTTDQLLKPYYMDVYVVYNLDTLKTQAYSLRIPLPAEGKGNFTRLLLTENKRLPPVINITIKQTMLQYNLYFYREQVYHGKVILEFIDKPKIRQKLGYEKSVTAIDLGMGKEFAFNEISRY